MMFKTVWVLEHLLFGALLIFAVFLPAIVTRVYHNLAGRRNTPFSIVEHDRIERNENYLFFGGYLALIVSGLFLAAPSPANANVVVHPVVISNAATIVRARCLRTPPELRSPKCIRLVGNS